MRSAPSRPGRGTLEVEDRGPYVRRVRQNWQTLPPVAQGQATQIIRLGQPLKIGPVGDIPGFSIRVRGPAEVAPSELSLPSSTPLLVVADTHGQYESLVRLLQRQNIINKRLQWAFGKGRLVLLGDMFDRGPHQVEILWLIYELERQAKIAGGGVHVVLGNHEVMTLQGDHRYLAFKYADAAFDYGAADYARLFGEGTVLGQWLRSKPAILKINDDLFVHGGLSPEIEKSKASISAINSRVRLALTQDGKTADDPLIGPEGPLWYRGYFAGAGEPAKVDSADIDRILGHFGARRIFIGHTVVPEVQTLFEGRVVAVQVAPEWWFDRTLPPQMGAVLLTNGQMAIAKSTGERIPLPSNHSSP